MGLCKCERKRLTYLFCFEHRTNVCEFCLISDHPKCVVKSYLQWLKDSDYDPVCSLCNQILDGSSGDCVRLLCLDVFHWSCLNEYALKYPPTTAPAGYECPLCRGSIIPLANIGGPVAEALRKVLSSAIWARSHFETSINEIGDSKIPDLAKNEVVTDNKIRISLTVPQVHEKVCTAPNGIYSKASLVPGVDSKLILQKSDAVYLDSSSFKYQTSDEDDKYHRRNALFWLSRLFGSNSIMDSTFGPLRRRRIVYSVLTVFILLNFFYLLRLMINGPTIEGDILLDPKLNPNILVDDSSRSLGQQLAAPDQRPLLPGPNVER